MLPFRFRPLSLEPLFRFTQRALHCGAEFGKAMLQDVIRRATPQRFDDHLFAQRAGDEQERHIRTLLLGNGQSTKAVELRQTMVCEDDVRWASFERSDKALACLDALSLERQSAPF